MSDPAAVGEFTVPEPARASWVELVNGDAVPGDDDPRHWVLMPKRQLFRGNVWHYTNIQGAIGVLESGSLWATALPFLNDTTEFQQGLRVLEITNSALQLSKYVHPTQKEVVSLAISTASKVETQANVYVACASEISDSLSQWRAYGGESGVAIGISVDDSRPILLNTAARGDGPVTNDGLTWRRVAYGDEASYENLLEVLGFICHTCPTPDSSDEELEEFAQTTAAKLLTEGIALCKNEAFQDEREVRAVVQKPHQVEPMFRAGRFGPTPYVRLSFVDPPEPFRDARQPSFLSEPQRLPVTEITVGPGPHADTTSLGLDLLLSKVGIDLAKRPRVSTVPYR